jgi:hypothetical protein
MGGIWNTGFIILLMTLLLNLSAVLATLVFHEAGHYLAGVMIGCEDIKIVTLSSSNGTYTEMRCPAAQGEFFPIFGALLLTLPFGLAFFLLGGHPERNLGLISIGFNLSVSLVDFPFAAFQYLSLVFGFMIVVAGEVFFVDRLLSLLLFDPGAAANIGGHIRV